MRISDWSSDVCSSDLPASESFGLLSLLFLAVYNESAGQEITAPPLLRRLWLRQKFSSQPVQSFALNADGTFLFLCAVLRNQTGAQCRQPRAAPMTTAIGGLDHRRPKTAVDHIHSTPHPLIAHNKGPPT